MYTAVKQDQYDENDFVIFASDITTNEVGVISMLTMTARCSLLEGRIYDLGKVEDMTADDAKAILPHLYSFSHGYSCVASVDSSKYTNRDGYTRGLADYSAVHATQQMLREKIEEIFFEEVGKREESLLETVLEIIDNACVRRAKKLARSRDNEENSEDTPTPFVLPVFAMFHNEEDFD